MLYNGISLRGDGFTGTQAIEVIGIGNGQLRVLIRGGGGCSQLPPVLPGEVPAGISVEIADGITRSRFLAMRARTMSTGQSSPPLPGTSNTPNPPSAGS